MSNKERAAKLLTPNSEHCQRVHKGEGGDPCMFCEYNAETAADMLADAGLLAPDLPEPNEMGDYLEQIWGTVHAGDGYVSFSTPTVLDHIGARFFAHALLAAANETEKRA